MTSSLSELDGPLPSSSVSVEEEDWWSGEMAAAMAEVMPPDDPFYRADFDLTAHINALFPTEQSLSRLDETIMSVKEEMGGLDSEMGRLVVDGAGTGAEGAEALAQARHAIQELFTRIREIKAKTDLSESMVKEMTRDIKQLDVAKKNLTASITTLTHLQMLLEWLSRLDGLVASRQYGEMANILPSILNVLEQFHKYMAIPQIADIAAETRKLRDAIKAQVAEDFKDSLTGGHGLAGVESVGQICRVVSEVDGGELRTELGAWYTEQKLAEYILLFDDTQDDAWLDKIDQRYGWFRRRLVEFEEQSGGLFPPDWEMGRRLTREFCVRTKAMLAAVMGKRLAELDVKLLLHAIQRTKAFEALLCKRFPPKPRTHPPKDRDVTKPAQSPTRTKDDAKDAESSPPPNEFQGVISRVFESHLDLYVRAQDANLAQFLEQSQRRLGSAEGFPKAEAGGVAQPLPSSGDLFLFFKRTIIQLNDITTEPEALLALVIPVFRKFLKEYAHKCLSGSLPKIGVAAATLGTTSGLIQSLLREGEASRLSPEETYRVSCLLVTAEFCSETTEQLQAKLAERLSSPAKADLSAEQEAFHAVTTAALGILVQDLEGACEAALTTMSKMNWGAVESVGDESPYVSSIKTHLFRTLPPIRDHLANARRYFLNLCSKFSLSLVGKFGGSVLRLRGLGRAAAEQLQLDTTTLGAFLLKLPSLDSLAAPKPPSVYTKPLEKALAKIEAILKVVRLEEKPEELVSQYMKLVPDSSAPELQRVLELKGVRRGDQAAFLDLYRQRGGGGAEGGAASLHNLAAPLLLLAGETADSRIRKLERLVKGTMPR